jgi:hypothetical protein
MVTGETMYIASNVNGPLGGKATERLLEIDLFRATAILLMGMTHGLFWINRSAKWVEMLAYVGKFYCFTAFLVSFGMSLSIASRRGKLSHFKYRMRTLQRAFLVLIAYYIVAFGRYARDIFDGGVIDVTRRVAEYLLLLTVPKAGDFFLCFFLLLVMVAIVPTLPLLIERNPVLALAASTLTYFVGYHFSHIVVSPVFRSWWKLWFGSTEHIRTFPVSMYFLVFVTGVLLGGLVASGHLRRQLFGRLSLIALPMFIVSTTLGISLGRENPAALPVLKFSGHHLSVFTLEPVPSFLFLVASGSLSVIVFALCTLYVTRFSIDNSTQNPVERLFIYVGRNSIWIIVWQYVWIQLGARILRIGDESDARTVFFLITMLLVPSLLLRTAQHLCTVIQSKQQSLRERTTGSFQG